MDPFSPTGRSLVAASHRKSLEGTTPVTRGQGARAAPAEHCQDNQNSVREFAAILWDGRKPPRSHSISVRPHPPRVIDEVRDPVGPRGSGAEKQCVAAATLSATRSGGDGSCRNRSEEHTSE